MSRTFSANSGSVESLKVSARCGCRPKARQTRPTVDTDRPRGLRHACAGSSASRRPAASRACGPPGPRSPRRRSGAARPAAARRAGRRARSRAKRSRHLPTVCLAMPSSSAIAVLLRPSAGPQHDRAPAAPAPAPSCVAAPSPPARRARPRSAPAPSVSGRASAPPHQPSPLCHEFPAQDTSRCSALAPLDSYRYYNRQECRPRPSAFRSC